MSGHALHVAAHELDALEAFVHARVRQLPRLTPVASFSGSTSSPAFAHSASGALSNSAHLPARCASYHALCASMLQPALAVLAPLSPRLARLVAQVWELASLNVFALLQLAHAALGEGAALLAQCEAMARAEAESRRLQAERAARADRERELLRVEAQRLRAELQAARQRASRLAVDKVQLRRVLAGLLDRGGLTGEGLAGGGLAGDSRSEAGGMEEEEEEAADVAAVDADEEQALYAVDADALEAVELAHPLERAAADLDAVLGALAAGEARHEAVLNAMDRFVDSSAVGLLWRFGSAEQRHQLLERTLRSRNAATQTSDAPAAAPRRASDGQGDGQGDSAGEGDGREAGSDGDSDGDGDADAEGDARPSGGASGHAALVTRARALPAGLRAQLGSRPKVLRMLELRDAAQLVLELLVDKLDADTADARAGRARASLHASLKSFFLARYGLASLADFHLMELVKSALFHHERLRRAAALAATAGGGGSSSSDQPVDSLQAALWPADSQRRVDADEVRVALFARVCELVPFSPAVSDAGSPVAAAAHALVDLLGDVVELDAALAGLDAVERVGSAWTCPLARAGLLLAQHLPFVGRDALVICSARLEALSGPGGGAETAVVAVDALLALFTVAWLAYDQRLTAKLRDGFRRQLMLASPLAMGRPPSSGDGGDCQRKREAEAAGADAEGSLSDAPPIETLMRVFASLPDESVAPTALEELRTTLSAQLAAKQQQQQQQAGRTRGRRGTARKTSASGHAAGAGGSVCIGGVSENEFVLHALEVLRARRVRHGLRTNGRRLVRPRDGLGAGGDEGKGEAGGSEALWADETGDDGRPPVSLAQLKPGLTRRDW